MEEDSKNLLFFNGTSSVKMSVDKDKVAYVHLSTPDSVTVLAALDVNNNGGELWITQQPHSKGVSYVPIIAQFNASSSTPPSDSVRTLLVVPQVMTLYYYC